MKHILVIGSIIFSAVLLRLVPHVPNFAPIGAMALFGGASIKKRRDALVIIFLSMFLSDYLLLYIHPFSRQIFTLPHLYPVTALFHSTTLYVYGSFLLNVGIGIWLRKHFTLQNLFLSSFTSSILFFLVTNFGVWATGMYSRNIAGLLESYIMGLPFFRATVFGDLFYNGIFFSAYYSILEITRPKKVTIPNV